MHEDVKENMKYFAPGITKSCHCKPEALHRLVFRAEDEAISL